MAFRYRCTRCRARVQKRQKIERYVREANRVCPHCGGPLSNAGNQKEREWNKKRTCHCDRLPYPHRIGHEPFCRHSKREPTQEEINDLYGWQGVPG